MFPVIEQLDVKANFKYLWLKYVSGVNLNVHCARCLKGTYSTQLAHTTKQLTDVILDEEITPYYYLCGVAFPHKWANNFHLAFKYASRGAIEIDRNGILIRINAAEEIPIKWIDMKTNQHPKRFDKGYSTCRNWQFANMIAEELNAAH